MFWPLNEAVRTTSHKHGRKIYVLADHYTAVHQHLRGLGVSNDVHSGWGVTSGQDIFIGSHGGGSGHGNSSGQAQLETLLNVSQPALNVIGDL